MKRRLTGWLFLIALSCGLVSLLWLQRSNRVHLESLPPPQMTIGEHAEVAFQVPSTQNCRACSSDPTVAEITIISAQNNLLRCRVTALADGSASLSCTAGGAVSPAYALSVVPPETGIASGTLVVVPIGKKVSSSPCTYAKKLKTRIFFETAAEAEAQGYSPCKTCLASN